MASVDLIAGTVMNAAAALLNDVARSVYSYTVQIPYLNMTLLELQEYFELNNVPVTDQTSAVINVPAGTVQIGFNSVPPVPELPDDFIEPQRLWERLENIDPFVPMVRWDGLPLYMSGVQTSQFMGYVWEAQLIKLLSANADIDIKMEYIRNLFTPVTSSASLINVINAESFLNFRTAALLAEFVEQNKTRADDLNINASLSMDRVTSIGTKGRQAMVTRRRPFRSSFKSRGSW